MKQAECFYKTAISTRNAINSNFEWPDFKNITTTSKAVSVNTSDILDHNMIARLRENGFPDMLTTIFYIAENYAADVAHTDINGDDTDPQYPSVAFNLIVGPDTRDMVWFDPDALKHEYQEISYSNSTNKGVFGKWPLDFSHEIDRAHIGDCLTLVRVNVPHSVTLSTESRTCVSLRFSTAEFDSYTWDEIVHMFKHVLLPR